MTDWTSKIIPIRVNLRLFAAISSAAPRLCVSAVHPRLSSQARIPFCTCIRLAACCNDDALRAVDHFVGHFFAAMGRQAVHEVGVPEHAASARR